MLLRTQGVRHHQPEKGDSMARMTLEMRKRGIIRLLTFEYRDKTGQAVPDGMMPQLIREYVERLESVTPQER